MEFTNIYISFIDVVLGAALQLQQFQQQRGQLYRELQQTYRKQPASKRRAVNMFLLSLSLRLSG